MKKSLRFLMVATMATIGATTLNPETVLAVTQTGFRLDGYRSSYFGEKNTSFNDGTTGFGVQASYQVENTYVGYQAGVTGLSFSGQQQLLDGTTEKKISVSGTSYGLVLGGILNVIPMEMQSFRPYLGAGVEGGVIQVSVPTSTTLTELKHSQTSHYYGYYGGAGVAAMYGSATDRKSILFEFRYRVLSSSLFSNKTFELNNFQLMLGFSL